MTDDLPMELHPGLFIGSMMAEMNRDGLKDAKISHVLQVGRLDMRLISPQICGDICGARSSCAKGLVSSLVLQFILSYCFMIVGWPTIRLDGLPGNSGEHTLPPSALSQIQPHLTAAHHAIAISLKTQFSLFSACILTTTVPFSVARWATGWSPPTSATSPTRPSPCAMYPERTWSSTSPIASASLRPPWLLEAESWCTALRV